jgi:hypothetical protein
LDELVVEFLEPGIDIVDIRFRRIDFISDQVHDDFSHAAGGTITRALKDDVFHLAAAQVLNALLAEDPGNRVCDVTLAAAVWAYDGGDSVSSEDYFGVVGEGFEPSDFQALQFEH